jgi:hypothetical protein
MAYIFTVFALCAIGIILIPNQKLLTYLNWLESFFQKCVPVTGIQFLASLAILENKKEIGAELAASFLPKYKFYTELTYELLNLSKIYGVKFGKYTEVIKNFVKLEHRFDEKLKKEFQSGIWQMLAIVFTTWFFIYLSQMLVEIKIAFYTYAIIISLHLIGLSLFYFIIIKWREHIFNPYQSAISELLIFKSLLEIGMPVSQSLAKSSINQGTFTTHKKFLDQKEFFLQSLDQLIKNGRGMKEQLQTIIEQIFEKKELDLVEFQKKMALTKFLHLVLIFLPAYFFYLFSIFQFFMEQ